MFVRPDLFSGGYLRHPVAACTTVHSTVSLHVLRSNPRGSRFKVFSSLHICGLLEQVIHLGEHLLGSGANVLIDALILWLMLISN